MIHKVDSFSGTCDNCQDDFQDYDYGYTLFIDTDTLRTYMSESEWYMGDTDPDHKGKHYCPKCYKEHPEEDDKIIVDESRKKEPS